MVVDRQLAEDQGLRVGQLVGLSTRSGVQDVEISGIGEWGDGTSIGGATLVVPRLADVQRWFQRPGDLTRIAIAADPGVAPARLAAAVRAALPRTVTVKTGAADAAEQADTANDAIGSFLTPALLALSGAALLVGAFIIFNTFSITVAQRSREFALLRSLGATRAQILLAVAAEALVIGVTASVLGLFAGLGIAAALGALFDAALDMPSSGLVLAGRTIALALGIGIGVTLLAAVAPALRATRVPPVAALSADPLTGTDAPPPLAVHRRGREPARPAGPRAGPVRRRARREPPRRAGRRRGPAVRRRRARRPLRRAAARRRDRATARPRASTSPAGSRARTRCATPAAPRRRRPR